MSANSEQPRFDSEDYKISKCDEILSLMFKPGVLDSFPVSYFQHLSQLTYLGLSGNNIVEIGKELFLAFPNLTWLDLRSNHLTSFPRYANHDNLETILLGDNNIKRLPIELGSFPRLCCLQTSENPLEFPSENDLVTADCEIISYLKSCWQQKTEKPNININKKKQKPHVKLKKSDCLQPVKHFRNVSNVLVDKIRSNDPIDHVLAEHVAKKLRNIEKQLQKSKDKELLKNWRERYMAKGFTRREKDKNIPFGTDEEFSNVISREELNNFRYNPKQKRKLIRINKKPINFDEELKKIQQSLGNIKNRETNKDFSSEMSQRMFDLKEINEIQKRIKQLKMAE